MPIELYGVMALTCAACSGHHLRALHAQGRVTSAVSALFLGLIALGDARQVLAGPGAGWGPWLALGTASAFLLGLALPPASPVGRGSR